MLVVLGNTASCGYACILKITFVFLKKYFNRTNLLSCNDACRCFSISLEFFLMTLSYVAYFNFVLVFFT